MINEINKTLNSNVALGAVYLAGVSFILADIIPTPADAVYFSIQQKNKAKLERNEITPAQYWKRDALAYYGLNPIWWSLVLGALLLTKGDYTDKLKVGVGIIGAGAVIGVLNRNIKKDLELQ
jgi:hypothetical protein